MWSYFLFRMSNTVSESVNCNVKRHRLTSRDVLCAEKWSIMKSQRSARWLMGSAKRFLIQKNKQTIRDTKIQSNTRGEFGKNISRKETELMSRTLPKFDARLASLIFWNLLPSNLKFWRCTTSAGQAYTMSSYPATAPDSQSKAATPMTSRSRSTRSSLASSKAQSKTFSWRPSPNNKLNNFNQTQVARSLIFLIIIFQNPNYSVKDK